MLEEFLAPFQSDWYLGVWNVIDFTWPVWLPVFLIWLFMTTWLNYRRRAWLNKTGSVLLEIRIPKDTVKSPAAMLELKAEEITSDDLKPVALALAL